MSAAAAGRKMGIGVLFALDARLAFRHKFLHVVAAMALLFGALLRFAAPAPPRGALLVPLVLAADIALIGFLFGGVMILQEKSFGTLRLYRVSPGGPFAYVTSKLLLNTALSALGALLFIGLALPPSWWSLSALLLAIFTAAGLSLLGMGMAAFFPSLAAFFYPMVLVATLMSAPMAVYALPSLDVPALEWLPTYHLLLGARELFLPSGRADIVGRALVALSAFFVASAAFAYLSTSRRLMKEVG